MAVDYSTLKKGGFMRQKQKNCFSLRLRTVGGHLSAEQLAKIAEVADKYGEGYIHLTSRQGVEIPFIRLEQIDEAKNALEEGSVTPGVCGPRVRTITACQGSAVCPSGCIDTYALAQEIDERYFGRELPHKFKFGITGCQNNCLKAEENDAGIIRFKGQLMTYVPGQGPCYRCVFKNPPPKDAVPTCKQAGVVGAMGGVIGSLQAMEAIKFIVGQGDLLTGNLLTYDALKNDFRKVKLPHNPNCPICGAHPTITKLIDYEQAVCEVKR